jgi:hypothetical protein
MPAARGESRRKLKRHLQTDVLNPAVLLLSDDPLARRRHERNETDPDHKRLPSHRVLTDQSFQPRKSKCYASYDALKSALFKMR